MLIVSRYSGRANIGLVLNLWLQVERRNNLGKRAERPLPLQKSRTVGQIWRCGPDGLLFDFHGARHMTAPTSLQCLKWVATRQPPRLEICPPVPKFQTPMEARPLRRNGEQLKVNRNANHAHKCASLFRVPFSCCWRGDKVHLGEGPALHPPW